MRHTNFKPKDTSFKVIDTTSANVHSWKFTLADGLTVLNTYIPNAIGDYFSAEIITPDEDCWLLLEQNGNCSMIRVGDPEVLTVGFTGEEGGIHEYAQYDMDGTELANGYMTEIGNGFYYAEPVTLAASFFDLGGEIKPLSVPYRVVDCTNTGGGEAVGSPAIFNNTGFNMFGFLGERYSYFDQGLGKWVNDENVEAKASDLAKAVCHKYGLVWDDTADTQWVGNYIKYIRSYTENDGKIRYYKPFKTPDTDEANFSMMQDDEAGNLVVKGISMLLLQPLETVNGTDGVTIPFREV